MEIKNFKIVEIITGLACLAWIVLMFGGLFPGGEFIFLIIGLALVFSFSILDLSEKYNKNIKIIANIFALACVLLLVSVVYIDAHSSSEKNAFLCSYCGYENPIHAKKNFNNYIVECDYKFFVIDENNKISCLGEGYYTDINDNGRFLILD